MYKRVQPGSQPGRQNGAKTEPKGSSCCCRVCEDDDDDDDNDDDDDDDNDDNDDDDDDDITQSKRASPALLDPFLPGSIVP